MLQLRLRERSIPDLATFLLVLEEMVKKLADFLVVLGPMRRIWSVEESRQYVCGDAFEGATYSFS